MCRAIILCFMPFALRVAFLLIIIQLSSLTLVSLDSRTKTPVCASHIKTGFTNGSVDCLFTEKRKRRREGDGVGEILRLGVEREREQARAREMT